MTATSLTACGSVWSWIWVSAWIRPTADPDHDRDCERRGRGDQHGQHRFLHLGEEGGLIHRRYP